MPFFLLTAEKTVVGTIQVFFKRFFNFVLDIILSYSTKSCRFNDILKSIPRNEKSDAKKEKTATTTN